MLGKLPLDLVGSKGTPVSHLAGRFRASGIEEQEIAPVSQVDLLDDILRRRDQH